MFLLDHLKRIAVKCEVNKMTTHNLAVCFGPVLLCPSPQSVTDLEMDFKRHIDVLHYLLDIWPENRGESHKIYKYHLGWKIVICHDFIKRFLDRPL